MSTVLPMGLNGFKSLTPYFEHALVIEQPPELLLGRTESTGDFFEKILKNYQHFVETSFSCTHVERWRRCTKFLYHKLFSYRFAISSTFSYQIE